MAEPPRGLLIGILIGAGALLFVMRGIPIVNFNALVSFGSGPTSLSQPRGGHVFEFDKDLLLKRHNYHRCQHEVEPLTWSDSIAGHAQEHAESAGGQLAHSSQIFRSNVAGYAWIGENLFLGDATMKEAVDAWYGEVGLTDDGRVKDFDERVGHYTQLVWEDTKEIGCGFHGMLLVCEYGPAGNVLGQFAAKVPRRIHDKKCPWSDPPEKARPTEERGQSGTVFH